MDSAAYLPFVISEVISILLHPSLCHRKLTYMDYIKSHLNLWLPVAFGPWGAPVGDWRKRGK